MSSILTQITNKLVITKMKDMYDFQALEVYNFRQE